MSTADVGTLGEAPASRGPALGRTAPLVLAVLGLSVLIGDQERWGTAVVLGTMAILTGGGVRAWAALAAVGLVRAALPPPAWPTYWVCFVPLVAVWRGSAGERPYRGWESWFVGFAIGWTSVAPARAALPTYGVVYPVLAGLVFGLQVAGIAWVTVRLRARSPLAAAPAAALAATAIELVRAYGLNWPFLILALPAAPTPLAQWARFGGVSAVSFALYLINFLAWPDRARKGIDRWLPPLSALALGTALWWGGRGIAARVAVAPPRFSALLVQPHEVMPDKADVDPKLPARMILDRLTRRALAAGMVTDLIVWPEFSVPHSFPHLAVTTGLRNDEGTLAGFFAYQMPVYRTPCLVGVPIKTPGASFHDSACLVTPRGDLSRYDRRVLTTMVDTVPPWLEDRWLRDTVLPWLHVKANFRPGEGEYRPLEFETREGRRVRLGVSMGPEIRYPWLPQYRPEARADAIVHLSNESWYADFSGEPQVTTWSGQYRAIETRTWQLVCSTWARSAAIDPRGRVRSLLPAGPGFLRVAGERDEVGRP